MAGNLKIFNNVRNKEKRILKKTENVRRRWRGGEADGGGGGKGK